MNISSVPGQAKAKQMLQNALRSGQVSHAYLFSGPTGTGRMALAMAFAKALFCTAGGDDACGQCLECRKFDHGNQPDLHRIAPDGASVKLGQVQSLQRDMAFRTTSENRKVYIIEQAETMTIQAANSLLKFLEEPPSPTVAMLITDNTMAVLPTIRSRSQIVPFLPFPPEDMLQKLVDEGFPHLLARAAVQLSPGLAGAKALMEQNGFAEMRNVVIQLGKEGLTRFTTAMITAQQRLFKTGLGEQSELFLSLLLLWFKDMIHFQAGRQEKMVFIDQSDWISAHAFAYPLDYWVRCMEYTLAAGKKIAANVPSQLAVEQLMVNLQEG